MKTSTVFLFLLFALTFQLEQHMNLHWTLTGDGLHRILRVSLRQTMGGNLTLFKRGHAETSKFTNFAVACQAVVPCCVFSRHFPWRRICSTWPSNNILVPTVHATTSHHTPSYAAMIGNYESNGQPVRSYDDLCKYFSGFGVLVAFYRFLQAHAQCGHVLGL